MILSNWEIWMSPSWRIKRDWTSRRRALLTMLVLKSGWTSPMTSRVISGHWAAFSMRWWRLSHRFRPQAWRVCSKGYALARYSVFPRTTPSIFGQSWSRCWIPNPTFGQIAHSSSTCRLCKPKKDNIWKRLNIFSKDKVKLTVSYLRQSSSPKISTRCSQDFPSLNMTVLASKMPQ